MTSVRYLFLSLFHVCILSAQTPRDFAVDLSATVSTNTPCITLAWSIRRQGNISAQKMHRRLKGETAWVKQADLATNQTSYADATAAPYVEYEYWMERTYTGIYPTTAMGYLSAGVNIPMLESRGKLVLVIDDTMIQPLAPEIEQLRADLTSDGWTVQTLAALRTNTAATVRNQIVAAYDADPLNVKMVYLLGHVPVPYSGNMAPDGHSDHVGAWPSDGYYGEMNGTWTDTTVNNTSAARVQNDNVPGDGKFDQSSFPNFVELMVGRVDLHSMTRAPASSVSETMLLRRYLRKAHDFRMKQGPYAAIPRRSIIRDGFGQFGGEAFSICGWAWSFTASGTLIDEPLSGQWFSGSYAGGKTYLVGYGNGGGSYESASTVGNTADFGLKPSRAVFTSLFGSYFGDWDSVNNFLRAPLAGNATGDSLGLTCFWGGRPNRFMHHLGMGETAGYGMWASQNGTLAGGGSYTPNTYAGTHSALMGDPALRLYSVEPPRNLTAISSNSLVALAWNAATETNLLGYHVYRSDSADAPFTRLTATPQSPTSYTDHTVTSGVSYTYLVRTLKRETVPGGSFDNLSAGTPLTLTASSSGTASPRNPGSLSVVPYASTHAVLSWVDTSDNETGFLVERKVNSGGSFSSIGSVAANVTNFTDMGVFASGNVYYYRVIATGAAANSLPSSVASFDAASGFFDLPITRLKTYKMAGSVSINVNRIGGSNGIASVNFTTVDTSAYAGPHYVATNGTLTWADGETAAKTITVPIINNAAPQAARQFKVVLSSPSNGTALTVNSFAAILIEDPTASLDPLWSQTIINGITDNSPAVTVSNAICSVTIGGAGVSASSNYEAGQFVYRSRVGDGILTAYFPAGIPSDSNARYALMIRSSTANNAIMAAAVTSSSASHGTKLAYRSTAGSYYATTLPSAANALVLARWLRLTRTGATFVAETSSDGTYWTTVASATISSMPSSALWGIFHYSSDWSVTGLGNYHLAIAESVSLSDLPPPLPPSNLTAVATSPHQVSLKWTTVAQAEGYHIERCHEYGGFTQIVTVVSGSLATQTWNDVTVSVDSGYAYRVSAYNSSGTSDYSPTVYVTTPLNDIVTLITTEGANGADATVQLNLADTPLGTATDLTLASYDPETWDMLTNAAKAYIKFDLSGLSTLTKARLKLAFVRSDDYDFWNYYSLYFYLLGPTANNWDEESITWNNAPQNEKDGFGFYNPLYSLGDIFENQLPLEGQEVFFDLDAVTLFDNRATNNLVTIAMTQYGGAIMHWASKEHLAFSAPTLEASVASPFPLRPSFLTAEVESGWTVTLRWQDCSANETGFELERRTNGGEFETLPVLASNTVHYIDATTLPNTTYEYRLRSLNGSEPSSWTILVSVTTPDPFFAVGTVWDSGGANTLISTPANWDLDRIPDFSGSAYFNFARAGNTVTVNTNVSFLGMSIHRDADFTFTDGGGLLTLGSGGLRAFSPTAVSRIYTIATSLSLGADQCWGVTNNGAVATHLVIAGPVTDGVSSFGITKSGNGLLTLSGNSDYDGITFVSSGGGIHVAHANALGSANGGTEVAVDGWVEISGNVTVPEPMTLRDANDSGALRSTGGSNVWSGPITLANPTRLRALAGSTLTLSGGISGSSDLFLSPDEDGEVAVSGLPLALPSRKIYAYGSGVVTIGPGAHTFGTLEVSGVGLRVRMGAANVLPASCILSLGAPQGVMDLNGFDQTVARLIRGNTTSSTNRLVTSDAPATLTVNETSSGPIYFNGHLTGALGLTKGGSGYLSLTGAYNTYTGATTVVGGTLEVGSNSRLGFSRSVMVKGGTLNLLNAGAISDDALLSISDEGGAKVRLDSGIETVASLILGGNRMEKGTWGASGSGADNIDDIHFAGAGIFNVLTTCSSATWDAGSTNTSITVSNNWDYDTLPSLGGSAFVIFGLAGSLATVDSDLSFLGMLLNRDGDFTFADGGGVLSLGAGGLSASAPTNTSCVYTLAAPVTLAADQNWGITNSGAGVTALTVSGPVTDGASSFGITKSGNGLLTLSGNNAYDGHTSVGAGGGLLVAHGSGLGSASGGTDVAVGGWLEVSGHVTVPEPLTLRDANASGALRSTGGTNVWSGPVTLEAATRLRALPGSALTLAGGISGSSDLYLSPDEGGELAVSGLPLALPSRKIYAYGSGVVTIGPGAHSFGTLEVSGVGLRVRMGAANVLPASCILSLGAPQGVVDLNGFDQTVARLIRGNTVSSTNRLVTSDAPATLTVNETSSGPIYFNGHLTGALGLTKGGSGYLTLSGAYNTYTGATTVNAGTLEVTSSARLGFSERVTVSGGTLKLMNANALADTATLRIATGGKVYLQSGTDTVSTLYFDGKRQRRGTYGSSSSDATYKSDIYFSSGVPGVVNVQHGPACVILVY
jgi:autotransporter-associated beta strand protein